MHEVTVMDVIILIVVLTFGFLAGTAFMVVFNERIVKEILKSKKELIYDFEIRSEEVISNQVHYLEKTYKNGINHVNDIGQRIKLLFNGLAYVDKELKEFNTGLDELQSRMEVRKELENEIIKLKNIIKRMERKNG